MKYKVWSDEPTEEAKWKSQVKERREEEKKGEKEK